ncbi:hypothetical protein LTR36_002330 [Oleoguttula mirabilis]|uniref:BTB domain-containing protein n=1 Tax=Oleoguttula mirabilis TaxID=1507867 RepID=A0AAV9JLK5_9PEZI|nr:hypothetical protein LTR36_002330 [Oleoguttula mirabilis]
MTANTYWQLEKEYYTIATEHDLVIRLIEHENVTRTGGDATVTESKPYKVHEFKVKRDTLSNSGPYFRKLLSDGNFKEAGQDTIDLHEDGSVVGFIVWFKVLHATVDDTTYQASIDDIWNMLATAHKYGFDPRSEAARGWFAKWYDAQQTTRERSFDYKDHAQLLFPCYTFDHAQGFRAATKYLVYRATGHIVERRPPGFAYEHLRLDQNVLREPHLNPILPANFTPATPHVLTQLFARLEQLNAAKGRLKTILHRNLYNPIDALLKRARCRCKANVLYAFEQGLANTGAWPLEAAFLSNSVERVLKMLEGFPGPQAFVPQTCGAQFCSFDFAHVVGNAKMECKRYFDGLCLDCMNASHPKLGDADEDYWAHSKLGVHWDQGCRIRHQQPSWYFSFLGRRQKMVEWVGGTRETPRYSGQRGGGSGGGPSGDGQAAVPEVVVGGDGQATVPEVGGEGEEVPSVQGMSLQ